MPGYFYGTAKDVDIWKSTILPEFDKIVHAFGELSTDAVRAFCIDALMAYMKNGTVAGVCRKKASGVADADYASAYSKGDFTGSHTAFDYSKFGMG